MKIQDIIVENKRRITESIRVIDQDYDLDQVILTLDIEGRRVSFTYTDYDEDFDNAERKDVFDQLMSRDWYRGLDHPTRMEILDAAYRAIRGLEPKPYQPSVGLEPMDVGDRLDEQGVAEGLTTGRNLNPATKKYVKDHKWKLTTINPMGLDTDAFDDSYNRVIDIDPDHPVDFNDPIIVDANGVIIDGFHRVYQAKKQGLKKLPAYVPQQGVAEGQLDFYRLERLDPQTRRVLARMADHKEPGSWLSAADSYAIQLGLQYKNRDPRGWEREVQHYVDLWNELTGKKK